VKRNFVAAMVLAVALLAATASAIEYSKDAKMILPKDYREWVFLSSGIGMTYIPSAGDGANPSFENIFVNPEAYRTFVKTGTWPDKTVLILESRASESKVSINKDGRVQTNIRAIEAHVKDASRGGWNFYGFGNGTQQEGTLLPKSADCYSCHEQNGAVDTTFVQFYPTLAEIAKAKGTFAGAADESATQKSTTKRFELSGVVKSVDSKQQKLVVQHGDIPGFMAAMTMPYNAGKQEDLKKVSVGDQIHADVVVNDSEMHLENIAVTGHSEPSKVQ
jgi:Cu/Ag efflux protein CusF